MKHFSLRHARKIDQRLAAMITEMKTAYTGTVQVSMYDQTPVQTYEKLSGKQSALGNTISTLIAIRKQIRDNIAIANHANGITTKISRRKELIDLKELYSTMEAACTEVVPVNVGTYFDSKKTHMQNHPTTETYVFRDRQKKNKDMVEIPVVTDETLADIRKKVKTYSSELEQVEEELLSINAVVMVGIVNDADYEVLKELGVV